MLSDQLIKVASCFLKVGFPTFFPPPNHIFYDTALNEANIVFVDKLEGLNDSLVVEGVNDVSLFAPFPSLHETSPDTDPPQGG